MYKETLFLYYNLHRNCLLGDAWIQEVTGQSLFCGADTALALSTITMSARQLQQ